MATDSSFGSLTLEQVLEDLSSRFIVNMPPEELTEVQRVCFQIEAAHWFYEDFIRPHNAHLPTFHMRAFSELVFNSVPLLAHFAKRQAYDSFLKYKLSVPVCGAILVSEDWKSCLVVKGMKSSNWGFPQGKINQAETEMDCAIREVWEEVGYDISPYFDPSRAHQPFNSHAPPPPLVEQVYPHVQFIEREVSSKRIRLYIIPGVPVSTAFETKTRGEIAKITWADLTTLPTWNKKSKAKDELKGYLVASFVPQLKSWYNSRKPGRGVQKAARKNGKQQAAQDQPGPSSGMRMLQPWQPDEPDEPLGTYNEAYEDELAEHPQEELQAQVEEAQHLERQSEALQALFFGAASSPKSKARSSTFEPTTTAAVKSPKAKQHDRFTPPEIPVSPPSQNQLPLASPKPSYPPSERDSLLRMLQQSALQTTLLHQVQQPQLQQHTNTAAATHLPLSNGTTTMASSTVLDQTPRFGMLSENVSPMPYSSLQYSHGGSSQSSVPIFQPVSQPVIEPFTEDEREEARRDILANLASQLGTGPTPPSPEGSDEEDFVNTEDEDSAAHFERGATNVQELVDIFKLEQQAGGSGRQFEELSMTNAVVQQLAQKHAVKLAQQAMLQNSLLQNTPDSSTDSRQPSMHPQSREQIRQLLNAGPPRQTETRDDHGHAANGHPAAFSSPYAPHAQDRQIANINEAESSRHPHILPPAPNQHAQQLLGLLTTKPANPPSQTHPLHTQMPQQSVKSPPASYASPSRATYVPQAPGVQSPPLSDEKAALLSLFNAATIGSSRTQDTREHIPAQIRQQASESIHPPDFADGSRRREFDSLVQQDSMTAAQLPGVDKQRHIQSLNDILRGNGVPPASQHAALPVQPTPPQPSSAGVSQQQSDLLKLFAAASMSKG